MKISNTAERLKTLMNERGLRQVDILNKASPFCEQYNVKLGRNDLSQYVNGKNEPGSNKLTILGLALGVSESWLMGYDVPMERKPEATQLADADNITPYSPTHKIPILGRISAGLPLYADEHVEGYTYTELNGGAEYLALRVRGDSMNALGIQDGSLVIVRRQECVENGDIAVVLVDDDEATIKRFYQDGDIVTLMPQSTNPEHLPQIYDLHDTRIRIIGKAIEIKIAL